ncbi:3-methyl-2-oxobutanoate hydroxymethyltransferase [Aureliella helgolandensis]|uniref:3-methyl-2-oxobutanoate hydroxymethyltransferase n=1 Tax=Aureliella helgolandensis TaxID=2527968 RepID=A0A518GHF4_9BACT|nr:3-methyl-2-oxobutanoate hydroxymethyltransferase [Aureliella helgolandensis]QDV28013.1 3-methyl-2-oxobutanoate hydroxymethyltransferase [Aureliella helgolandensis]
MATEPKQVTTASLLKMKQQGERISMLTAYDFTFASLLDEAGVDMLLVGDSLGMVIQGNDTTIPVTLRQMIYHGQCVVRGTKRAMVVVDLPFPHGQLGVRKTLQVAARVMKKTGCAAIKLEGGAEQADTISALVSAGIPVIAHVGLRPQSVHALGGYRVQRDAERIEQDAVAAQQAGAFCVLMECVPSEVAKSITDKLRVPTIGIGAGAGCDGQVLVTHDMLGLTVSHVPKFVRQTGQLADHVRLAVGTYNQSVRDGTFPSEQESFR